jgi:sugar transferase (PEP-CTERM system associated)
VSVFRLTHPRYLTSIAVESGLVFGVLYALVVLNRQMFPELPIGASHALVSINGFFFIGGLLATRRAILGEAANFRREMVILAIMAVFFGVIGLLGWIAYSDSPGQPVALLIAEGIVAVPLSIATWRWFALRYQVLDCYRERILIVGAGESARHLARWMGDNLRSEYQLVGFADNDAARIGDIVAMGARVLTRFSELRQFSLGRVDRIIVAVDEKRGKLPMAELVQLRFAGLEIEEAASFFERTSGQLAVETMLPSWLVFSDGFKVSVVRRIAKRLGDIAVSLVVLILTAPVMLVTAALIALESRGPVLYRQRRMGRNGVEFDMLKFRSMVQDAEQKSGPTWAGQNDPRVTRIGRVIRKLRIDELPQVINVFRGEMSFVGPRPERKHFVEQLQKEISYYSLRMTVRPGITGWAQVQYRYGATVEDALYKLKYDLFYIKNSNALYDLWILIKTVKVVFMGSGAR